jgi:type I restriction enzyme S subunit
VKRAGLYLTEYEQTYSEAGLAQSKLWPAGTLCITIAANIAETSILAIDACFPDSVIGFIADSEKADARFIKYLFDAVLKMRFRSFTQGAAQDNLSQEKLLSIKFPVPELMVQRRIADVLSAYDDLIDNNRRRIALLEEAARMLYREWFVAFRFPGHEHVKMSHGLPEGWERRTFDKVCDAIGGGTPSTGKPEYWDDGEIPWYTPTDVTRNSCLALLDSEKKITDAGLRHSSAKRLPAGTILMTSRASVGFFGIIDAPSCTNQGFISILPRNPQARMYLLHNLMHRVEEIRSHAGGTTYKEISKGKFKALPVILPEALLLREFEGEVSEIHIQVRTLHTMNRKLAQARDLLLPRLMNGQIPV